MNLRDFDSKITEAPMNPGSFSKAVEVGQSEGVLVGYEFEIGIPSAYVAAPEKEKEKDYESIMVNHLRTNEALFDTIGLKRNTPAKLDQFLVPSPEKNPKFPSFKEAKKGKSNIEFYDNKGTIAELMCKMFPVDEDEYSCIVTITDDFDKYFKITDAKGLYDYLTNEMNAEFYEDDEEEDWEEPYDKAAEKLASQLESTFNTKVKIFNEYHQSAKKLDRWYIEPDVSLEPRDDGDAVLEVVTPPMPSQEAVQVLKGFFQLSKQNNFYTGKEYSTGLHINVSIPKQLDLVKLALFLGDQYLLKLFDREDIEYTWSMKKELDDRLQNYDDLVKTKTKKKGKKIVSTRHIIDTKKLESIAKYISEDHYASINYNGKYISFRHAGGDYLNDYENVINVVGRFVRAMIIASDDQMYRKEYMKKLAVLVSQTQQPRIRDIDKAREYLKLLQFVKTKGYPVLVGSEIFGLDKWDVSGGMPNNLNEALDITFWSSRYKRDVSPKARKLAKQNIINYYSAILPPDSPLMKMYNKGRPSSGSITYMVPPSNRLTETIQILDTMEFPLKGTYYNKDWAPIYHIEYLPATHALIKDTYKQLVRDYQEYMDGARKGGYVNESEQAPIYYFAYGMLTDPDYLPGAELMGVAELRNFEFTMYAYANVEPETGSKVYGTLWKLDKNLLSALDQIEAYPELYDRRTYPVYMDGKKYPAEVYLMTPGTLKYVGNTVPKQQYINTILKGYENAGVPTSQLYDALDFYGYYE